MDQQDLSEQVTRPPLPNNSNIISMSTPFKTNSPSLMRGHNRRPEPEVAAGGRPAVQRRTFTRQGEVATLSKHSNGIVNSDKDGIGQVALALENLGMKDQPAATTSPNVCNPSNAKSGGARGGGKVKIDACTCDSCVNRLAGKVVTKWEDSLAKKHIRQCLEDDEAHCYWKMKPGDLYNSNKVLFHQYKYTNFRTNLNALKKSIALYVGQIKFDEHAFKIEAKEFKRGELTSHGNPFYDTSSTRVLLVKDVKDGTAEKYKNRPRELRATRPEYKCFNSGVFTKHVNREIRRQKEEVGWQHRRNLQGSKNYVNRCDAVEGDKN